MNQATKPASRWISRLLVLFSLWCLLGFLVVPGVMLHVGKQQLAHWVNVPSSLERVGFNPFTLELEVHNLWLGEPEQPITGFRQLKANVAWRSLWSGVLILERVQLKGLRHNAVFNPEGQFNLLAALNLPERDESPKEDSQPFPLRIEHIQLEADSIAFNDQRQTPAVAFDLSPLSLSLHNLSTLPDEQGELTLSAHSPHGAELNWQGQLSLLPLRSQGHLSIANIPLPVWWPYAQDSVALSLSQGSLSVASDYQLDLREAFELQLSQLQGQLKDLAVAVKPQPEANAQLAQLSISGASLNLQKRRLHLGTIESQGLKLNAQRFKDGRIDWQALASSSDEKPTKPAVKNDASPAWQISLQKLSVSDYNALIIDQVPDNPVKHTVGPLSLSVADYRSDKATPLPVTLKTELGKKGTLEVSGQLQPAPLKATLNAKATRLDLRQLQQYIAPFVRVEIRSGWLDTTLAINASDSPKLAISVQGQASIDQLHTLDTLKGRDLLRWQKVEVNGIDFAHQQHAKISEIVLHKPFARFIVNEDRSTNLSQLVIAQEATGPKPENPNPLAIELGSIRLVDGSANFADFSLEPEFDAGIEQLNGQVKGISSTRQAPAIIDIKGKIDRYAPALFAGTLTPFDPLNKLDMQVSFNKVELTTLTPYSGKFAGYSIRKGRMSLNLNYKIEDGRLKAENKILLEKLQLGEQVDSPDAVKLPVRLGLALMTDADGNIDLDIPITGNLNDPQFRVAPLVFKAIGNLIAKAAASPFKLLGGLLPGDNTNLGEVAFSAGSFELNNSAQKSLSQLAEALKQKPVLRLEIEGVAARDPDSLPEAQKRLERELKRGYYRILQRRGEDVPDSRLAVTVPDDFRPALLATIYRERIGQPPADWQNRSDSEQAQQAEQALVAFWQNSEVLLRKLGQARSTAIKNFLVDSQGLAPERLFLLDARIVEAGDKQSVTSPLHLEVQ
ncbi:DUF748 domain-containing protein [Atopomonas hussainii]|uniref:DUF748 domain-containing protein n=1 Tax=Atopomonas hussainii TaxID=1429083 RepID=UPI0009002819|nr:DUF748 domain-containing protein [Atopomonas hussainii]